MSSFPPAARASERASRLVAVVLWMSGALLSFSATAVALRELAGALALFDALASRNAIGLAIALAIALVQRRTRDLAPRRMTLHLARNVVHAVAIFAWSFGLTLMPLATVFALEFTAPAWVTVLAAVILRERLDLPRLAAVALGIAGVLVILRPGAEAVSPAALLVLGAAFGFALVTVCTKLLTRTESTLAILFWLNAIQLPMNLAAGLVLSGAFPPATVPFGVHHALAVAALGLGGFSAHWCLTNAYQRGDAILVLPLDFLRIPLIALIARWLYGEALDPLVFAGAALIVVGILGNLVAEARRGRG